MEIPLNSTRSITTRLASVSSWSRHNSRFFNNRTKAELWIYSIYLFNIKLIDYMEVKIKKLNEKAVIPRYAHNTDAGLDLVAVDELSDSDM